MMMKMLTFNTGRKQMFTPYLVRTHVNIESNNFIFLDKTIRLIESMISIDSTFVVRTHKQKHIQQHT